MINQLCHSTAIVIGSIGSVEQKFVAMTLEKCSSKKTIIFPRDEIKQWEIAKFFQRDFVYDCVIN